jgi:hypothetical protein
MDNVTFIEILDPITGNNVQHAIIDHGNEEFTSMTKAHYDELKANEALKKEMSSND